ncbi:MAG: hypothetical protein HRT67_08495, partial [Flavobacteriaceae bacterium]|nr:hypothetical protein [Flavobacteriaceae bacterium]
VDPDGRCTTCSDNAEVGATHYDFFSEQTYTMTKNGWGTDGGAVGGLSTVFLTNKAQPTITQGSAVKTNENGPWNFRWGNSDNFIASLSYKIANDAFQVVQTFDFDLIPSGGTNPLTGGKTNLNIDGSSNYKPVDGFVNTVSTLIPTGRGVQGLKSVAPKGLGYLEKLNAAQFSQTFKGNLARLAPATRGKLNKALNMGVNYINNQVANGMMLLHSLKFKSEE